MALVSRLIASTVLLVCALIALNLQRVPQVIETPEPETPLEIVEIMEAVQDGSIEDEAKKAAGQFALTSAGDTCMMRHRRVLAGVPRDVRQKFAAARIAENSVGREIQASLASDLTGMVRWRVLMQVADIAFRQGNIELAKQNYSDASKISDVPLVCISDMQLLAARLAKSKGDLAAATQHLKQATLADPVHFNAQFERAIHAVSRLSQGQDNCVSAVSDMVDATVRIQALLSTSTQLFRLSERVSQLQIAERDKSFLLGFVEERAGNLETARMIYEEGLQHIALAPSAACRNALSGALDLSRTRVINTGKASQ